MINIRPALKHYIQSHGIKLTHISSKTGIAIDKLSTSLNEKRNLSADELLLICGVLNVNPLEVHEQYQRSKV